jgi:hypothetical protein
MHNCSRFVGFEVIMAVTMKSTVFWVVTSCSSVEIHPRFRGKVSLKSSGSKSTPNQKQEETSGIIHKMCESQRKIQLPPILPTENILIFAVAVSEFRCEPLPVRFRQADPSIKARKNVET